jgi:hypothetical protein
MDQASVDTAMSTADPEPAAAPARRAAKGKGKEKETGAAYAHRVMGVDPRHFDGKEFIPSSDKEARLDLGEDGGDVAMCLVPVGDDGLRGNGNCLQHGNGIEIHLLHLLLLLVMLMPEKEREQLTLFTISILSEDASNVAAQLVVLQKNLPHDGGDASKGLFESLNEMFELWKLLCAAELQQAERKEGRQAGEFPVYPRFHPRGTARSVPAHLLLRRGAVQGQTTVHLPRHCPSGQKPHGCIQRRPRSFKTVPQL